jgi:hypothetical protein
MHIITTTNATATTLTNTTTTFTNRTPRLTICIETT